MANTPILQGQASNTGQASAPVPAIRQIAEMPEFWAPELDDIERVEIFERVDPQFKQFDDEFKFTVLDKARRKFNPNVGEKIQDFASSTWEQREKYLKALEALKPKFTGAYAGAPILGVTRGVADALNQIAPNQFSRAFLNATAPFDAFSNAANKGFTGGIWDPNVGQKAAHEQAGLDGSAYENPWFTVPGELTGALGLGILGEGALYAGIKGAAALAKQNGLRNVAAMIYRANRSNLAPWLKDALIGGVEGGIYLGAEKNRQETGSPFAFGFDPQGAAIGAVAAPAFRGLLTGAGKVAQNIFGNNTAPISLPKQNPMEQVNLQGSATKTSTLDDVVGQTTPQRLQAGRDRLQAAISKGDVTIGGKGGVSKTLVERLDKYVSKAQSKGLTKTEQLRAEKTLSEINKRVSNKAKPVAKLPEKKTPEAKPLKGKVEKTTKNISDDTNKVSEAPEHAQLKGSATEMVDQALEGTPYKSLQDIQNDLAERVKYGTSKQAESTKYKATGPMPKTIGALKTAVKKLRAELDDTPELFDTTADQLAKYKKQADLFISDKTTSKDPIGYGEKLYRVLKRLKKVTEINNRLEQVHPHLRELMKSPDIDFKNGTASQIELEPYRTASYNDVKFRLKDKKKYGDLINKAMKQGKQILAKYKANIGGHTSTLEKEAFREKTLTPIAWAKPGKDSVGTRFWAYNEQGHLGQYYVDASRAIDGEVSELVEIPQLLETAGIEGLYANSYKKPGQFKISDWLGRSLREEGVVDREIVRLMESTDKMLQSLIESDLPAPVKQKISKLLDAESIGSKELEVLQKQLRTPKHLKTLEQLCQILGI